MIFASIQGRRTGRETLRRSTFLLKFSGKDLLASSLRAREGEGMEFQLEYGSDECIVFRARSLARTHCLINFRSLLPKRPSWAADTPRYPESPMSRRIKDGGTDGSEEMTARGNDGGPCARARAQCVRRVRLAD